MVKALLPVYICLIGGIPLLAAFSPFFWIQERWMQLTWLFFCLPVFALTYVTTAGLLSRFTLPAMVRGKFPRDLKHPVYGPRRLHALCWTAVYYCTPIYFAALTFPALKAWVFTLFGYRHSTNFTVYPDTWLRDLPVLKIEEGAYLSNRATIASNMCLTDGTVIVDHISFGRKCLVGHLAAVGPGSKLAENTEVGVYSVLGIKTRLDANSKVGPCCAINHGAVLESGAEVGTHSFLGVKTVVRSGVKIPAGSNIPPGSILSSQTDLDRIAREETTSLDALRNRMAQALSSVSSPESPTHGVDPKNVA